MKQPHTEATTQHTDDQQNTGNHKLPGASKVDEIHGTRAGAENVEKAKTVEKGTDLDKVPGLDESGHGTKPAGQPHERTAERDEHGRM